MSKLTGIFLILAAVLFMFCCTGCHDGGGVDRIPPDVVNDLTATASTATTVTLTWTAPANTRTPEPIPAYELRYSTSTITEENWDAATPCPGMPVPGAAGATETLTVTGLDADTLYYFALRTADLAGNWSVLSNVASRATNLAEIHYDGENGNAIGLTDGGTFDLAVRFTPTEFADYVGDAITSVKVYYYESGTTTYTLKFYDLGTDSAPGTLLYSQAATVSTGWNEITLDTPITIPNSDLWVGYEVTHTAGQHPAGMDDGMNASPNGLFYYYNGTWVHYESANLNLRLVVTEDE